MSVKAILVLCAQALLLKSALGQTCTSRAALAFPYGFDGPILAYDRLTNPGYPGPAGLAGTAIPFDGLASGCAGGALAYDATYAPAMQFTPTSGGALPVSSASAIAPVGISVASDNIYEGALAVVGELPFVGTVGVEGVVTSAGAGAVNHACGNGRNAMISENAAFAPAAALAPLAAYGPGFGLRGGLAGRGCGCAI